MARVPEARPDEDAVGGPAPDSDDAWSEAGVVASRDALEPVSGCADAARSLINRSPRGLGGDVFRTSDRAAASHVLRDALLAQRDLGLRTRFRVRVGCLGYVGGSSPAETSFLDPRLNPVVDARRDGQQHDHHDDQAEVVAHDGKGPELVTGEHEGDDPQRGPDYVEKREPRIVHLADAGHERSKRADDRHETGQHDRLATVLLVEPFRHLHILPLEDTGVGVGRGCRTQLPANPVVDRVAQDGRGHHHDDQHHDVQAAEPRERSRRKQQRVAG